MSKLQYIIMVDLIFLCIGLMLLSCFDEASWLACKSRKCYV